tara:strand:+ start:212 stop:478 length:267 start_codon:yes stop_codon:yes gene_type:complete
MKIEKNIPFDDKKVDQATYTAQRMEVGDSVYFDDATLLSREVGRLVRALKKLGYKTKSKQVYHLDKNGYEMKGWSSSKIKGIRVWRIE